MYPVSDKYIEKITSRSVNTRWYGSIKTTGGAVYPFTQTDISQGSGKITRQICAREDLEIGTTCAAGLDISIYLDANRYELYNGTIKIYFQLQLNDGSYEEVPLGEFYILDPPERSLDLITIHAYDAMLKFDKEFGQTLIGTPYYMLNYACNACGVGLGSSQSDIENLPNGTIATYIYEGAEVNTFRDLIGYIAAYLCSVAYIGTDGLLYIKPYSMNVVRTIPANWRYGYVPQDYETSYSALTAYFMVSEEYEYFSLEGDGLTYELGANPLIQFNMDETRQTVLNNILGALGEITYTPFTATVPCDPSLMVGDVLNFTGNHAIDGKLSAITKQVITINGSMELACVGSDPNINAMTEVEKQIAAVSNNANKDGMYYYDYVNAENIRINDGDSAMVIWFNYATTKATHIDFHGEVRLEVDTTEVISEDGTAVFENDGVIKISYFLNGAEVAEYYPHDTFTDGMHLLHLLHTFMAQANTRGTFYAVIECEGCSVDIDQACSRGYIAGVGLAGGTTWDGSVYVEDNFRRKDFSNIHKNFNDNASVRQIENIAPVASEMMKRRNFSTFVKGISDNIESIMYLYKFSTTYGADSMTCDNAEISGNTWVLQDTATPGTVTTPNCAVNQIYMITSQNSGGDVGYVVSFDGGLSWWMYVNDWVECQQDSYGMLESTLHSITTAQWDEKLNGTIMVRAILTNNATLTDIEIYTEVI